MKIPYVLAFLLIVSFSQTYLTQQLNKGYYLPTMTEQRQVPRFYACGIQVFRHENWNGAREQCCTGCYCRRCWSRRLLKRRCCWQNKCDHIPATIHSRVVKGIKVAQCHHRNWQQQFVMGQVPLGQSLGMKMCPQNTYMNGFTTKLNGNDDGMTGLIIQCTNPRKRSEVHHIAIFDGDNTRWQAWSSSHQFVTGVSLKVDSDSISKWKAVGLSTKSFQMPIINSFEIKYNFPKDFFVQPDIIDEAVITNHGTTSAKKEIELNFEKQYQRLWQNDKRQLHGLEIGQSETSSVSMSASMTIPFIDSSMSMTQMNSKTSSELQRMQISQGFKFGTVERFKIGQKQKDIIQVPACTKYTIQQIVYTTTADVPYVLRIGYTNGPFQEYENINGYYKGVSTSKVETKIKSEKICDVNP